VDKYQITPIVVGHCQSPAPRLLYLGDPAETIPTIFTFFLLRGADRIVLVDAGFTAGVCEKYMPDVTAEQDPLVQLRSLSVEPENVDAIIITHAHFDHLSSGILAYPNAKIYMQRREYEFVTHPPHPWFREMVDVTTLDQLASAGPPRFNLIDGEDELFPGIRPVLTPGHTAGHMSVLVETHHGKACITGDALLNDRNLEEDTGPGFNCNLIEAMQSIQKIRDLSEAGAVILTGHDPKMLDRCKVLSESK